MVSITNFGQNGPYRDFKGTNLTVLAMGGLMNRTGEPDREPLKNGGSQAEYLGGLAGFAAASVTAFGAMMSGVGQHVDVSIQEVIASGLEGALPYTSYIGPMHNVSRGGQRFRATIGIYPCADGFVGVHANAREWPVLLKEIDSPELANDPRFDTLEKRLTNNRELELAIMNWTVDHTKAEIYEKATKLRTCWAAVLNTRELFDSPQYKARNFFVEIDHPETGPLMYPGSPFKMSESPWQVGRAPLLGEHNEEIYCGRLGYTKEDLARLRAQGVI
jgi:crotonobetainyl-CoA:carnitine CoA-transferase CaiB-like acyl-CoA transferase